MTLTNQKTVSDEVLIRAPSQSTSNLLTPYVFSLTTRLFDCVKLNIATPSILPWQVFKYRHVESECEINYNMLIRCVIVSCEDFRTRALYVTGVSDNLDSITIWIWYKVSWLNSMNISFLFLCSFCLSKWCAGVCIYIRLCVFTGGTYIIRTNCNMDTHEGYRTNRWLQADKFIGLSYFIQAHELSAK
jgi:hypothetical protein